MLRHKLSLFFLFILACCLAPLSYAAKPVILNFHSQITVEKSGEMMITEHITVKSYNKIIKRGIYRDIPTRYVKGGKPYSIGLDVIDAQIDSRPTNYRVVNHGRGVRIYIGKKNKRVGAGVHTYTLTYTINRGIGFYKKHDELYWNVTGPDWKFPIKQAAASVTLPQGAAEKLTRITAYTGRHGERGKGYKAERTPEGKINIQSTKTLSPGKQMTLVVGWPKGFVKEPTAADKWAYFLQDYQPFLLALGAIGVLLLYYIVMWRALGRDPDLGTVIPLYVPPKGYTPASLRYICGMDFDNKVLTSGLIDMAVKGCIEINETESKSFLSFSQNNYQIIKTNKPTDILSKAQIELYSKIFSAGDCVDIKKDSTDILVDARKQYEEVLKDEYSKRYFKHNFTGVIIGMGLTLIMCLAFAISLGAAGSFDNLESVFIITAVTFLATIMFDAKKWLTYVIPIGFALVALLTLFIAYFDNQPLYLIVTLICSFTFINTVFCYLLRAPTKRGTKILRETLGFKMFLEATEKDQMAFRNPPEKTPELFEKYLPYAIALDVEQKWCEKFNRVLANISNQDKRSGYQPSWYRSTSTGSSNLTSFSTAAFASSFSSSFNSAIASAANPSSGSGFSGGGAGGGGGGGGGGGW